MNRQFDLKARLSSRCSTAIERARGFRRGEDGGLTILTMFFFIVMLMIGGLAVDLMRFETSRVINQATMDRAVLAAAGLGQELDPQNVVIDYYVKAGLEPPELSDIAVEESYIGGVMDADGNIIPGQGGELVSRRVQITSHVESPNYFTYWPALASLYRAQYDDLEGNPPLTRKFQTAASTAALERIQNVEISLVVDISGSMGWNNRIRNLKTAANEFFETVIDEDRTEGITSISIIPYNASVVTGPLINYLNADGVTATVANPAPYPGALLTYPTEHQFSSCIRFDDADFNTVEIGPGTPLRRLSHFHEGGDSYNQPTMNERWCNENRSEILVHSTSIQQLKNHINGLSTGGWTAVDKGVKWGAALLDPALRPVVEAMIEDNIIDDKAENRPNDYVPVETIKVLVVMTDGENTVQRDLKDEYKNGPSRIWYSEDSWKDPNTGNARYDNQIGRWLTWRDGYWVEMPSRSTSQRWYRPGHWNTTSDNRFYSQSSLPADAKQQHYIELYDRFAETDLANFFFHGADTTERNRHRNAVYQFTGYGAADDRMEDICDAVKQKAGVLIFTLAFEAPDSAKPVMKYCATGGANGGFYYETDGTGISDAFRSIAGQITQLRLTQ